MLRKGVSGWPVSPGVKAPRGSETVFVVLSLSSRDWAPAVLYLGLYSGLSKLRIARVVEIVLEDVVRDG